MNYSTPDFPVLYHLPEIAQTHVHWVSDTIQPSHPLSPPSSLALSLSQHQGLFQWVSLLHHMAKELKLLLQQVIPVNIQGWFPLGLTGLISMQSKGLSRVSSNTTVQKYQFFDSQPFLWSSCHVCTWKTIVLTVRTFVDKVMSLPFKRLSWLAIAFLPGSKCLLISWLQSPSAVILITLYWKN